MPNSLNTNVHVDGVWYRPGEVPPPDVAARITNPKVWDDEDPPSRELQVNRRDESPFQFAGDPQRIELEQSKVKEPPRGGPGSSADAWRTFMAAHEFDVPEGASAKDMQAAWDARNEG